MGAAEPVAMEFLCVLQREGRGVGAQKAEHLFLERECQSTLEKNAQRSGRRKRFPR